MPLIERNRCNPLIWASLAAIAMATPLFAQQQDRISRDCRQEIVRLCGSDRSQIRSCLREKSSELSNSCSAQLRERIQQRSRSGGVRGGRDQSQTPRLYQVRIPVTQTVLYGSHIRQQVDIYAPKDLVDPRPMVLFVHGGGWSMGNNKLVQAKPTHFTRSNYFFASTGYRLLRDAPVEEQAADVGAAVRALVGQANAIGFDPDRIVLMGHSAGAHLAALVASDPKYAGDAFDAIKGVVLLDGAGYDIPTRIATANPRSWQVYNAAFGSEPARQTALSPLAHVGEADAPNWLALYVEEREDTRMQSQALMDALAAGGSAAQAIAIAGTDHTRMNRELGTEAGAAQTEAVDGFLSGVFE